MEGKIVLCKDCHCCPAVEFVDGKVHLGEEDRMAILSREEWNILVEKIRAGELRAL